MKNTEKIGRLVEFTKQICWGKVKFTDLKFIHSLYIIILCVCARAREGIYCIQNCSYGLLFRCQVDVYNTRNKEVLQRSFLTKENCHQKREL